MGQPRLHGGKGPAGWGWGGRRRAPAAPGCGRPPTQGGSPGEEGRQTRSLPGTDGETEGGTGLGAQMGLGAPLASPAAHRAPGPLRRGRSGEPGSRARGLAAASGVLLFHNGGCVTLVRAVCPYVPSQKLRWVIAGP